MIQELFGQTLRQNLSADDGGKTARSPGRARRKPLKPLRAGMPGDSGVLVVTRVRSTTTIAHETAGALGIRHSPRPLRGERFINGSGAWRGEVANVRLELGQRHCERSNPGSVIPGWSAGPDPKSRDSGFDASHRPGMTESGLVRGACHRARIRATRWLAMTVSGRWHSAYPVAEYDDGSLTCTAWNP
jgi:hypothetical protein